MSACPLTVKTSSEHLDHLPHPDDRATGRSLHHFLTVGLFSAPAQVVVRQRKEAGSSGTTSLWNRLRERDAGQFSYRPGS